MLWTFETLISLTVFLLLPFLIRPLCWRFDWPLFFQARQCSTRIKILSDGLCKVYDLPTALFTLWNSACSSSQGDRNSLETVTAAETKSSIYCLSPWNWFCMHYFAHKLNIIYWEIFLLDYLKELILLLFNKKNT